MMNVGLRCNPDVTIAKDGRHKVVCVLAPGQKIKGICQWVLQVANVPQLLYVSMPIPGISVKKQRKG